MSEVGYKHDGKLDALPIHEEGHAECVLHDGVHLSAMGMNLTVYHIFFNPRQALSLLAYLYERKDELEQLAKEQEQ